MTSTGEVILGSVFSRHPSGGSIGAKPEKVDRYFEAVSGLLSGEFRILEQWRGRRPVTAQLQRPSDGDWANVATWADVSAVVPWPRKTLKVVQNKPLSVFPGLE
jgi:hypothetical protein